jgi:hypothetical protein
VDLPPEFLLQDRGVSEEILLREGRSSAGYSRRGSGCLALLNLARRIRPERPDLIEADTSKPDVLEVGKFREDFAASLAKTDSWKLRRLPKNSTDNVARAR